MHPCDRIRQAAPLLVVQTTSPNVLLVYSGHRAEQAHGELIGAHLHTENRDWNSFLDRHVLGDIQGKCRLSHRRSSSNDDQLALLKPGGFPVQIGESGRQAGNVGLDLLAVKMIDTLENSNHNRLNRLETLSTALPLLSDLHDP